MPNFAEVPLLVVFTSFDRYTAEVAERADVDVTRVMAGYYELAGARIAAAGGRVVKFIGDATLAVFPPAAADQAVLGLLDLKEASDRFMAERGWECHLVVKVHYGTVAAGRLVPAQTGATTYSARLSISRPVLKRRAASRFR